MAERPVFIGIVGWKNSGKTTLIERLVPILKASGLKVASVKHTHHPLRLGDGKTDGERHLQAGTVVTVVIGPDAWEVGGRRQDGPPPKLGELGPYLAEADLVIVEGFKTAPHAKIEVRRRATQSQEPMAPGDAHVIAVVADAETDAGGLPLFHIDDVAALAGFIAARAG